MDEDGDRTYDATGIIAIAEALKVNALLKSINLEKNEIVKSKYAKENTLKGESFASRVAASLLNSINMSELVTESTEDYENLALKIFSDNDYFENIKSKIKENKKLSNLFNSAVYTKNIEKAYTIAYQNFIKGESPKNIEL